MVCRPRDICSAAFANDLQRLRLLLLTSAPGGLENNEEDDLSDEDEAAIDADPELVRLHAQYNLTRGDEEEEADDVEEFGEEGEAELDEEEAEAQEADFDVCRRFVRRELRARAIAALVNQPGTLQIGTNLANIRSYGVLFSATEANDCEAENRLPLHVEWKPSLRSPFAAYPLHWAVLGKAHEAIAFLIEHGADTERVVGAPGDSLYRPEKVEEAMAAAQIGGLNPTAAGSTSEAAAATEDPRSLSTFPVGLTALAIAKANKFEVCANIIETAVAAQAASLQQLEAEKQRLEGQLEQRKARKEKRRLAREQRSAAREEAEAKDGEDEEDEGDYEEDEED